MPAGQTIALDARSGPAPLHKARSFRGLPDRREAGALLAELVTAPCLFSPPSPDRPLALYGAGNFGRLARDHLRTVGLSFALAIDRNARTLALDDEWAGTLMLHPDDVSEQGKSEYCLAVSVATSPYAPLERELAERGFRHVVPFYDLAENFRHLHPLSNGWFAPELTVEDQANTRHVLAGWADDISRAHHLQFLAWRRLREEWTFDAAPVEGSNRFFIPEIVDVLERDEVLLDGGAHHGSVTQAFMQATGNTFRRIVAVEPDPANRTKLVEALPRGRRIAVLDCALGEHAGHAPFHHGLGYASQISPTGRMTVAVRPIDDLNVAPTFIKLHLEGSELAALKGARGTMLAHRAIVATTVYHNADGIWRTALWLMRNLPRYSFLFRTHSWCGTGAVIYAIPQERLR